MSYTNLIFHICILFLLQNELTAYTFSSRLSLGREDNAQKTIVDIRAMINVAHAVVSTAALSRKHTGAPGGGMMSSYDSP